MWCNGPMWGPWYGWWMMPLFGIVCMVIFLYAIVKIFGNSGFRGPFSCGRQDSGKDQGNTEDLKEEVRALRAEILALKENKKTTEEKSS